jgi:hypothetical protein
MVHRRDFTVYRTLDMKYPLARMRQIAVSASISAVTVRFGVPSKNPGRSLVNLPGRLWKLQK